MLLRQGVVVAGRPSIVERVPPFSPALASPFRISSSLPRAVFEVAPLFPCVPSSLSLTFESSHHAPNYSSPNAVRCDGDQQQQKSSDQLPNSKNDSVRLENASVCESGWFGS